MVIAVAVAVGAGAEVSLGLLLSSFISSVSLPFISTVFVETSLPVLIIGLGIACPPLPSLCSSSSSTLTIGSDFSSLGVVTAMIVLADLTDRGDIERGDRLSYSLGEAAVTLAAFVRFSRS